MSTRRVEMEPQDSGAIASQVDSILEHLPVETAVKVDLPSRGQFYGDGGGVVSVKPLTFEDEKALVSIKDSKKINPLSTILSRCVEGVDTNALVYMDKMFLIMKIRELSYGEEYQASVICPKCTESNPLSFKLSELEVKYVPEDLKEPMSVLLPKIKKDVEFRLPRVSDESYIIDPEIMMDNIWRFIVSIDGNKNPTVIAQVIRKLPSADLHTMIKAFTANDYGIETKAKFKCFNCKEVSLVDIPISENFFSVN